MIRIPKNNYLKTTKFNTLRVNDDKHAIYVLISEINEKLYIFNKLEKIKIDDIYYSYTIITIPDGAIIKQKYDYNYTTTKITIRNTIKPIDNILILHKILKNNITLLKKYHSLYKQQNNYICHSMTENNIRCKIICKKSNNDYYCHLHCYTPNDNTIKYVIKCLNV